MPAALSSEGGLTHWAKSAARNILRALRWDLTQNLAYDRMTADIISTHVAFGMNCIDVGCHKGEILELLMGQSPDGVHLCFEPIPEMAGSLAEKFSASPNVQIERCALSDSPGRTSFQHVRNAPAYSGMLRREYAVRVPDIEEIEVEVRCLDDWTDAVDHWDFLKIDVEGAELQVLQGAQALIRKHNPLIVFECGLGASDHYGTSPKDVTDLLMDRLGYRVFSLGSFLDNPNGEGLNASAFQQLFEANAEYYFVAAPGS